MRRRFRRLFRHPPLRADQIEHELDDEIASHIAARAEQLERLGMSPDEARAEALHRFGDLTTARRQLAATAAHRGSRMRARERSEELRMMTTGVSHDLRVAARTLRLHPTFAIAVVATLALAIAAAVTAFSFVDAMFLRPLPVPDASRLVHVYLPRHDGRLTSVGRADRVASRAQRRLRERRRRAVLLGKVRARAPQSGSTLRRVRVVAILSDARRRAAARQILRAG